MNHQFLTPSKPDVCIIFVFDRPVLSILRDILAVYQTQDLTMVLTAAQMTTFFEHADQMGIPHTTVVQLHGEAIEVVADLVDFDKDSLQQFTDNLRHPGGHVPDPNPGAPAGATIPTPPFVFGAISQKCIAVSCDLVRFYTMVGHDLTAANLQWSTNMKNFEIQWKLLKERKGDDSPDVPKISKALVVIKWMEAFQDFLNWKIGNHNIPLAYIIHDEPNPPAAALPLAAGQPHSIEHGSIESELIARALHTHALFCNDNSDLYYLLEEATWATNMPPPLSPSNEQRMVVVHGWPLPANMLGKTSGRLRSRNKSNCYIPVYGKARVTSCSNTLSPNTTTHMYQCQHVQNMFDTNCPMNTHALVF